MISSFKLAQLAAVKSLNFASLAFFAQVKKLDQLTQFETLVLKNQKPVIVDFYADWCGPCRMLAPKLQQKLDQSNDQFEIVKIDIDSFPELADKYKISSIPAVFLFHNGKPLDQFLGLNEVKLDGFAQKATALATSTKA